MVYAHLPAKLCRRHRRAALLRRTLTAVGVGCAIGSRRARRRRRRRRRRRAVLAGRSLRHRSLRHGRRRRRGGAGTERWRSRSAARVGCGGRGRRRRLHKPKASSLGSRTSDLWAARRLRIDHTRERAESSKHAGGGGPGCMRETLPPVVGSGGSAMSCASTACREGPCHIGPRIDRPDRPGAPPRRPPPGLTSARPTCVATALAAPRFTATAGGGSASAEAPAADRSVGGAGVDSDADSDVTLHATTEGDRVPHSNGHAVHD